MGTSPHMLILDYALSTPVINEGIAFYFVQAGCTVSYRQFYPNLVGDDAARYEIIALLAGRTPAFPSGMMSVHEVATAAGFVRSGGTLILGPNLAGGEGANERHLFNRMLAHLGVAIRVCNDQVEDSENGYAAPLWDRPFYRPVEGHPVGAEPAARLAFERTSSLVVGSGASVLLTSFDTARPRGTVPVMAMARAGAGTVLVAGRYLLNATGVPLRISGEPLAHPEWLADTGVFLQHLADYTVGVTLGTTAWTDANPLPVDDPGPVGPPDFDLDRSPVLDRVPPGVQVVGFEFAGDDPDPFDLGGPARVAHRGDAQRYGWIDTEGVRASWGSTVDWGCITAVAVLE